MWNEPTYKMIKLSLKKKKNSFIIDYFKSAREFFTNSTMLIPKMQSVFWYVKVLAPFFFSANHQGSSIQVNYVTLGRSIAPG